MPSSKNYKRDYQQENKYKAKPDQIKKRVARNKARKAAMEAGKVHKGDGKDVNHIVPLSKGGSTAISNTNIESAHKNRSFPRTKTGKMR